MYCEKKGHSPLSNSCPHKQQKIQALNKFTFKANSKPNPKTTNKLNVTFNPPNSSSPKYTQSNQTNNARKQTAVSPSTARQLELIHNIEQSMLEDIRTTQKKQNKTKHTIQTTPHKVTKKYKLPHARKLNYSQISKKSDRTPEKSIQKPQHHDLRNKINKTISRSSNNAIDKLIEFITQAIINVAPTSSIKEHEQKVHRIYNLAHKVGLYSNTYDNLYQQIYINKPQHRSKKPH